jgi:ATP-dependent helicase/nuclease subunit A
VTARAHQGRQGLPGDLGDRGGRFGAAFGTAVHRAIGLVLAGDADARAAASTCASAATLGEILEREVEADTRRAIESLSAAGLHGCDCMRLEYPVAGLDDDGALLVGAVDLVCVRGHEIWIVDFKSDHPPTQSAERELPAYCRQVRLYARLVEQAGLTVGLTIRCALLFTADGSLLEVRSAED